MCEYPLAQAGEIGPGAYSTRGPSLNRRTAILLFPAFVASGVGLLVVDPDVRAVLMPVLVLVNLGLVFLVMLWNRDHILPLFELGTIWVATTILYSVFPLLNFLMGGLQWTILSDARLIQYDSTAFEVGGFVWRHVIYTASFVAVYLVLRGRAIVPTKDIVNPGKIFGLAIFVVLLLLISYFAVLQLGFGVSYSASYAEMLAGRGLLTQLPYIVQQLSHNLQGMVLILKQAVLLLVLQQWHKARWRYGVLVWLGVEVVVSVLRTGARTEMALLLLSAGLLYHRLVKPFTLLRTIVFGGTLLGILLVIGVVRDTGTGIGELAEKNVPLLAAMNEFQAVFATSYDLYMRRNMGSLENVPWQIYVSDLYMLVPSQLLPFYKWDPSQWYLDLIEYREPVGGFMFGVISQGVIGLDSLEILLRGCLLGGIAASVHRWYLRRASEFWNTLLYLFLCVWVYYSFRASSFYVVYFVLYRFLPVVLLVRLTGTLMKPADQSTVQASR